MMMNVIVIDEKEESSYLKEFKESDLGWSFAYISPTYIGGVKSAQYLFFMGRMKDGSVKTDRLLTLEFKP
jgi:hypothetical protein